MLQFNPGMSKISPNINVCVFQMNQIKQNNNKRKSTVNKNNCAILNQLNFVLMATNH
jgi:hypothetical protein